MNSSEIRIHPIGIVRNDVPGPEWPAWSDVVSEVVIDEAYVEGLDGIEGFSHIIVLCWLHRCEGQGWTLKVRPEGRDELPTVGVFATRSPFRPNLIGITTVELLERQGNVLCVKGLDAFDGTPVLDVKPYLARGDRIENPRHPEWIRRLWAMHDAESAKAVCNDLELAREKLAAEQWSLVLVKDDSVLGTSRSDGIGDLLALIDALGPQAHGASLADRVVGKAVAMVARYAGLAAVYGSLASEAAQRELAKAGIVFAYDRLVPLILDKTGGGPCPLERLTASIDDPSEAMTALRDFVKQA